VDDRLVRHPAVEDLGPELLVPVLDADHDPRAAGRLERVAELLGDLLGARVDEEGEGELLPVGLAEAERELLVGEEGVVVQ